MSKKNEAIEIVSVEVLRSEILVVPNDNYRTDVEKDVSRVKEMMDLLVASGQLEEVGLMPLPAPGPNGEIYRLTYGFRRLAAWDRLGWGDSRKIRGGVKNYTEADIRSGKVIIDNYNANHHVPVHPYDIGRLICFLEQGAKDTNVLGEEIVARAPKTPEQVQGQLNLSDSQYRKFKKLETGTDLAVREEARAAEAPLRLLYQIASTKGEGETPEERLASRQYRQEAVLNEWVAKQKKLKSENRQRSRRVDAGTTNGVNGHANGAVKGDDTFEDADETETETNVAAAHTNGSSNGSTEREPRRQAAFLSDKKVFDAKGRTAGFYVAALEQRIANLAKAKTAEEKEARARAEGAAAAMNFLLGGTKTFPKDLLKEEDFKALQKKIDEVAAANQAAAN